MMGGVILRGQNLVDLQRTLAASTYCAETVAPHHPINCNDELRYDDTGFSCPHATVPPHEPRTVQCVQHSIALLIIELATYL
jgi:hypothetical protein